MRRLLVSTRRRVRAGWPRLHTRLYRLTGGRVGSRFGRLEQVLVTATGRRSGRLRTTPLAGIPHGDELLLVASNWGDDRHPGWFHNLVANPDVLVQRGSRTIPMRARVATEAEREVLWPVVVRANRGFETYAARTSRRIPLVICSPVGPSTGG